MKKTLSIWLLLLPAILANAQEPGSGANQVESGVYRFTEAGDNGLMLSGETTHFSSMEFKIVRISEPSRKLNLRNPQKEQIFIVKKGSLEVDMGGNKHKVGPNSVFFLLPGDEGVIESLSTEVVYYTMNYTSKGPVNTERGKKEGGSFVLNFEELAYKEHDKGGVRSYFNRATAMCPYYEMHVTNLNAGLKSHEPHTHSAAEIVLMIEGNTEMEIGDETHQGQTGDVYFLASNVPHAIKNIGDRPCMYFAFQWE